MKAMSCSFGFIVVRSLKPYSFKYSVENIVRREINYDIIWWYFKTNWYLDSTKQYEYVHCRKNTSEIISLNELYLYPHNTVDFAWLYILLRHLVWFTTSWNFFPKDKQKVVPIKDTELHETFLGESKRSDLWINFATYRE